MEHTSSKVRQVFENLRQKANSFFLPIILSFVCLLLMTLAYTGYNYWRSAKTMEKNINNYSQQISDNIKTQVDYNINQAVQTLSHLCYENRVIKYSPRSAMEGPAAILEVRDVMNYMAQIPLSYGQISDSFVYFTNSNIIVTSKGYFTPESYYDKQQLSDYSLPLWQWRDLLTEYHTQDMLLSKESNQPILIMKSLPTTDRKRSDVLVGVFFSDYQLQTTLREFSAMEASTALVSTDGQVIAYGPDFPLADVPEWVWRQEQDTTPKKLAYQGENYLVQVDYSQLGEWNYVTVFPSQLIMEDLDNYKVMTLTMVGLFLVVFALLVSYFRRKSYDPIKRLMSNIYEADPGGTYRDPAVKGNEIQLIHSTIERLHREQAKIKEDLNQQHPIIYNNVLSSVLQEVPVGDEVQSKLAAIELVFSEPRFIVLYIKLESSSESSFLHKKEDRALLKTVIINIAQDLFQPLGEMYAVEISWDELSCIVNSALPEQELEERVMACAEELLHLLFSLFAVNVTIGMSDCGESTNDLNRLYQMAQEAYTRKILTGVNTVNRYVEQLPSSRSDYFYPTYIEHKLINSVSSGDEQEAMRIIDVIFSKNFEEKPLSTPYLECLFYDIISTGLKLLGELHADPAEVFGQEDLEEQLLQCRTVDQARETITQIISKISRYVNENLHTKKEPLLESILEHIQANYDNHAICIASIAEAAGITESYLCHYFKEHMNITVMRYVEQLRLEKVKELLVKTDGTLSEIAEKTGYSNSSVLIRTFKRRTGYTPNQYRADRMGFRRVQ